MSTGSTKTAGKGNDATQTAAAGNGDSKKRAKRTYDHVMTEREKWALEIVRKCKNGLTAVAIAIQEGKAPTPSMLGKIADVQKDMAEMLFQ